MRVVRSDEAPRFEPAGHAGVVNRALVSTQWHATPEVSVWWGEFDEGGASSLHDHPESSQIYVVLSGSYTVDDGESEHHLTVGDTVIIGPGEPHRIKATERSEVMVITTPGLR